MDIPLPDEQMQAAVGRTANAAAHLEVGRAMKEDILLYTGVEPTANILDVGCGSGRVARHFVDYVRQPGRYVGMDIMKPFVGWCQENISAANPAFSFYHQDIYNGFYNPEGKYRASEYVFPFEDESFDLIILTSVFTHLLPEDTRNYLEEISRLLKPDGWCFSTWLLLGHDIQTKYMGVKAREGKVGYGFRYCAEMLERCGLTLAQEPVLKRWREQDSPFRLQDLLLLARKTGAQESLLARYQTPELPEKNGLEEVRGLILGLDPVRNTVTLLVGKKPEVFRMDRDVVVRANRQRADSAALREGQRATIRFGTSADSEEKIALKITARDQPRTEKRVGVIESVDLEHGYITLDSDREHITFEFDPARTRIRVNSETADATELRVGQRASLQYLSRALAVNSRDLSPGDETDPTTETGAR